MRRSVKAGLVVGALVIVLVGGWIILDRPWTIERYSIVDDHTLAVSVLTGPLYWTRVTSVVETSSTVTVTVTSFRPPVPSTGGSPADFFVTLRDPIAGRTVIDGSSGLPVPEQGNP